MYPIGKSGENQLFGGRGGRFIVVETRVVVEERE